MRWLAEKFAELNLIRARVSIQLLRYGRHPRAGANEMTRWNNKADRSNSTAAARTHTYAHTRWKFQRRPALCECVRVCISRVTITKPTFAVGARSLYLSPAAARPLYLPSRMDSAAAPGFHSFYWTPAIDRRRRVEIHCLSLWHT